jgi:hypothetical protein
MTFTLRLALLLAVVTTTLISNAQKEFEGVITYEIEYLALPPEIEGMEGMLPSESRVYYKGQNSRTEQDVMGSGTQVVIEDNVNNKYFVLMDMMGQKIVLESTEEEMDEQQTLRATTEVDFIKDKKEIAGYNCKKAIVKNAELEAPITIYYCSKLKSGTDRFKGVSGIPLQFGMINGGVQARMTAKSVEKMEVDESLFLVPEGYTTMTSDDMMQMLGGGGE